MGTAKVLAGMHVDASQVSWASLSLNDYLGAAYRVRNYQISGPEFMASERFDIRAKLPAGGLAKDVPVMLQALLEDRFQMKMHRESKDFPVYGLVVGKGGLKMQESATEPPPAARAAMEEQAQMLRPSAGLEALRSITEAALISRLPATNSKVRNCPLPRWRMCWRASRTARW